MDIYKGNFLFYKYKCQMSTDSARSSESIFKFYYKGGICMCFTVVINKQTNWFSILEHSSIEFSDLYTEVGEERTENFGYKMTSGDYHLIDLDNVDSVYKRSILKDLMSEIKNIVRIYKIDYLYEK
jgi:hypothetical protein